MTNRYDDAVTSLNRRMLPSLRAQAGDVARMIEQRIGARVCVTPVLVWWGPFEGPRREVDGVLVVHGSEVVELLEAQPSRGPVNVDAVAAALAHGRRTVAALTSTPR